MSSQDPASRDIIATAETSVQVSLAPRHAALPDADSTGPAAIACIEQAKSVSPVSLTPPPSSRHSSQRARSSTPAQLTASFPSSPPPTVEAHPGNAKVAISVLEERVGRACTEDELRSMIKDLLPSLQEARADAAHHKLQYQMLSIESAETIERIQVEMDMAQREVDVLQCAEQQRVLVEPYPSPLQPVLDPSIRPVHVDLYNSMVHDIQDLKSHNLQLETTISKQKRMILQQESEIATLNDRIILLRERLQENRDHLNRYRRPNARVETTPGSERSTPYRGSGHRTGSAALSREPRPFAALLHASDLMSKESPGTPRTPKRKRGPSASLSSLPVTPQTAQPRLSRNPYETPQTLRTAHFKIPQSAPVPKIPKFAPRPLPVTAAAGGHESDGTVSAVDDSEAETEVPDFDNDLQESQASLLASHMLRTPTRPRQELHAASQPGLMQGRLFGHVRKAGAQRDEGERQVKRARADDSAGLGIIGATKEQ
ncbi:hypothetical protein MBLNU459_g5659t1 [Dothideomycetes sp. NU459]